MPAEYSISKFKVCENYFTSLFALESLIYLLDVSTNEVDGKELARILSPIHLSFESVGEPLKEGLWPDDSGQGCGAREKAQA